MFFLVGAGGGGLGFGAGINTVSMMCTTPLLASLSAAVTFDFLLMVTWPSLTTTSNIPPSRVLNLLSGLRSLLCTAAPATTWYSRIASNSLMFFGSSNFLSSSAGILAKASLDGAKTVNGPLPSKAVTNLPALSAATSVDRSLSPSASSTMFFLAGAGGVGLGAGINTVSMMCTTPLLASLSAAVTLDFLLMITCPC